MLYVAVGAKPDTLALMVKVPVAVLAVNVGAVATPFCPVCTTTE
jgi:hypothetical protein